jgi:ABC-type uncharacterized transport system permease subunit
MSAAMTIQIILLGIAALVFVAAFAVDLPILRRRSVPGDAGHTDSTLIWIGGAIVLALLAWRALAVRSLMLPLQDFFDAFCLLAILLIGLIAYFRLRNILEHFTICLLPMIAILLLLGAMMGGLFQRSFHVNGAWGIVHLITVLGGSACFAAGCVGGCVYLLADRQLRRKHEAPTWRGLPALAAMERFLQRCAQIGFPLLTIAIISGVFGAIQNPAAFGNAGQVSPKLILAAAVWIIYALVLHVRFAPVFRGRRAAWLSIVGFVLLLGTFVAVIRMPAT